MSITPRAVVLQQRDTQIELELEDNISQPMTRKWFALRSDPGADDIWEANQDPKEVDVEDPGDELREEMDG